MKIFAVIVIFVCAAASAFAQSQKPLNEKLSEMFKQNFSEWKAEDEDKAFYPMISTYKFDPQIHDVSEVSYLKSVWTQGRKQVLVRMELADAERREYAMRMFTLRNISPPSYKIADLGDEAFLVKFHDRVEIAFAKYNVVTYVYSNFPSKYKKPLNITSPKMYDAPQAEVNFLLKAARLIADEITERQTIETLTGVKQLPKSK